MRTSSKAVLLATLLACALAARAQMGFDPNEPCSSDDPDCSSPGDPDPENPDNPLPNPDPEDPLPEDNTGPDGPDGSEDPPVNDDGTDPKDPPIEFRDPPPSPSKGEDERDVVPIYMPINVRPAGSKQCSQPKVTGPCRSNLRRWWFNGKTKKCERFVYGGCRGNKNNFGVKANCERVCGAAVKPARRHNGCALRKKAGPCKARLPRFFFDKASNSCKRFWYGGCQGNSNRFLAKRACEKACIKRRG